MIFGAETNDLAAAVVVLSLVAGVLGFLAGSAMLIYEWIIERPVRQMANRASRDLGTPVNQIAADSPIKAHGGLGEPINAIANLAKALKDLDRSTKLLVLSLAFFAVAAVAAVGDAVGTDDGDSSDGERSGLALEVPAI